MEKVVDVARRRQAGEKVPNEDKVFSIFESHTELIQRGRRDKPIEFGHKIMLAQTKGKFISDYEVYALSPSDTALLSDVVERHKELYRRYPLGVAADMDFHPGAEEFEELLIYVLRRDCVCRASGNAVSSKKNKKQYYQRSDSQKKCQR